LDHDFKPQEELIPVTVFHQEKWKQKTTKHFKVVVSPMYSGNDMRRRFGEQETEPDPRHSSF